MQRTRSRNRRGQSAKGDGGIESNLHNESREMVLLLNFCTRARYTRRPDLFVTLTMLAKYATKSHHHCSHTMAGSALRIMAQ